MIILSYCLFICSASLALAGLILTMVRLLPLLVPLGRNSDFIVSCPPKHNNSAPFVTIEVPIHNEPPAVVIETLRSLISLDYPNYEIIVFDNNTTDPNLWQPVEDFCLAKPDRIRFLHREGIFGFKAGALNYLASYVNPGTQLFAIVDADYIAEPTFLQDLVPYFDDPQVAIVQTPQGYRDIPTSAFWQWTYTAYMLFLHTYAPFCGAVKAAPFLGSMGLVRKSVLEHVGYWNVFCLTEDMELSQRILAHGYKSIFVSIQYGRGLMPFNYKDYRAQRFRWSTGNTQAIRQFIVSLCLQKVRVDSKLLRHLIALCVWFYPTFLPSLVIFLINVYARYIPTSSSQAMSVLTLGGLLCGVSPVLMIVDSYAGYLFNASMVSEFSLRCRLGAALSQLSLFYAVSIASLKGLFTDGGVFLRTPKIANRHTVLEAAISVKEEIAIAVIFTVSLVFEVIFGEKAISIIVIHIVVISLASLALINSFLSGGRHG